MGREFLSQLLISARYYGSMKGFRWTHTLSSDRTAMLFSLVDFVIRNTAYGDTDWDRASSLRESMPNLEPYECALLAKAEKENATYLSSSTNTFDGVRIISPEKFISSFY